MFGIGANELILILLFGFIIFGPDKMPAMAKTLGQAIRRFRTAQEEMSNVIKNEVYDPTADDPFKNPLDAISKLEDSAKRDDRGESFTERKARYDRQREAKRAAEQRRAARQEQTEGAQSDAEASKPSGVPAPRTPIKKKSTSGTGVGTGSSGAVAGLAATADTAASSTPSADELYGTKPRVKMPSGARVPAPVKAQAEGATPASAKAQAESAPPARHSERSEESPQSQSEAAKGAGNPPAADAFFDDEGGE